MNAPKKGPPASGFDLTALLWGDLAPVTTDAANAPIDGRVVPPILPADPPQASPRPMNSALFYPVASDRPTHGAVRDTTDDTYDPLSPINVECGDHAGDRLSTFAASDAEVREEDASEDFEFNDFTIEEVLDPDALGLLDHDDQDNHNQDADLSALIEQLDERPLSISLLTERLHREVLPRLRGASENLGYLTLGKLAYAVAALQGSDTHLNQVREAVERLNVPVVPSRAHQNVRNLPLAAMKEAKHRFGDLVQGEPPEALVLTRLGYAGLALRPGTRAFLMQAWMGHCLSRTEERHHTNIIAAEVNRAGVELHAWSAEALASREALILDNLWSVARIARKYVGQGVDIDDLIQFGVLGLLRAVEKNDPSKNFRFVTYASSWIWQRITRELADTSRLIRLPVHVHERGKTVVGTADALYERMGRRPTVEQVAEGAGINVKVVRALLVTARTVSLDRADCLAWIERHTAEAVGDPDTEVCARLLREQIEEVLASLNERERKVIVSRFGLDTGGERTLEEVGREFGVTRERIRQIEANALRKLRHPNRSKKLLLYIDLPQEPEPELEARLARPALVNTRALTPALAPSGAQEAGVEFFPSSDHGASADATRRYAPMVDPISAGVDADAVLDGQGAEHVWDNHQKDDNSGRPLRRRSIFTAIRNETARRDAGNAARRS